MLTEYQTRKWRIRDFPGFRSVQCTLQCKMAQVVLAAIGILAVDISTVGHDPMMFYDVEAGAWFYIDPTFGDMLRIDSTFANPLDLLLACLSGDAGMISGQRLPGTEYLAVGYFNSPAYPAGGMSLMTVHTAPQWAGGLSARAPYRFGDLPSQSAEQDRPGTAMQLMPTLGVGIAGLAQVGLTVEVRLRSNWPGHVGFQRSINAGASWASSDAIDYLQPGSGEVRYRSIDTNGFAGTPAIVTV